MEVIVKHVCRMRTIWFSKNDQRTSSKGKICFDDPRFWLHINGWQIFPGDLFDFDMEVEPMLEVLVGRSLEQGLMEVQEEKQLEHLRCHQVQSLRAPHFTYMHHSKSKDSKYLKYLQLMLQTSGTVRHQQSNEHEYTNITLQTELSTEGRNQTTVNV